LAAWPEPLTLFEVDPPEVTAGRWRPDARGRSSRRRDRPSLDPLGRLVERLAGESDVLDRARAAMQLRDEAEELLGEIVREANRTGRTWREIGAHLGVPFQTLHSRHGAQPRTAKSRPPAHHHAGSNHSPKREE
jgi:hypothetical protein